MKEIWDAIPILLNWHLAKLIFRTVFCCSEPFTNPPLRFPYFRTGVSTGIFSGSRCPTFVAAVIASGSWAKHLLRKSTAKLSTKSAIHDKLSTRDTSWNPSWRPLSWNKVCICWCPMPPINHVVVWCWTALCYYHLLLSPASLCIKCRPCWQLTTTLKLDMNALALSSFSCHVLIWKNFCVQRLSGLSSPTGANSSRDGGRKLAHTTAAARSIASFPAEQLMKQTQHYHSRIPQSTGSFFAIAISGLDTSLPKAHLR